MRQRQVMVNDRKFVVDLEDDGTPIRIKERKVYAKGSLYESFYNAPYWSAKHHRLGKTNTIVARILEQCI